MESDQRLSAAGLYFVNWAFFIAESFEFISVQFEILLRTCFVFCFVFALSHLIPTERLVLLCSTRLHFKALGIIPYNF